MSVRYLVVELVKRMEKDKTLELQRVQSAMYAQFPDECERLGFTPTKAIEEKWKKDIRFALQDAKHQGLIRHVGSAKSGLWKRV